MEFLFIACPGKSKPKSVVKKQQYMVTVVMCAVIGSQGEEALLQIMLHQSFVMIVAVPLLAAGASSVSAEWASSLT